MTDRDGLAKEIITEDKDYDLRFSKLTDEAFLKDVLQDEETRKWYPPSTSSDVDIFVRNWAGFARYNCSLTAMYKNEIVAEATIFLMPYVKVAHLAMMYVIVKEGYRNKGVERSLIKNINHLAKTKFTLASLHVEMFKGCPLVEFLEAEGYQKIVSQDNFVEVDGKLTGREIYEVDLSGE